MKKTQSRFALRIGNAQKHIEGLLNLTFSFVCNLTFIKIELLCVKT